MGESYVHTHTHTDIYRTELNTIKTKTTNQQIKTKLCGKVTSSDCMSEIKRQLLVLLLLCVVRCWPRAFPST